MSTRRLSFDVRSSMLDVRRSPFCNGRTSNVQGRTSNVQRRKSNVQRKTSLRTSITILAAMVLLPIGCAAPSSPSAGPSRSSTTASSDVSPTNTDPCAMRLHEVCGVLLLYYNTHHDLPPTLPALAKAPG